MLSENICVGVLPQLRKATISYVPRLSLRRYGTTRLPMHISALKLLFDIQTFFRKIQVSIKAEKISVTLLEFPCTCMIICHLILQRMRNVSRQLRG